MQRRVVFRQTTPIIIYYYIIHCLSQLSQFKTDGKSECCFFGGGGEMKKREKKAIFGASSSSCRAEGGRPEQDTAL